jgi:GNAT superfamily N-acetyltransferase
MTTGLQLVIRRARPGDEADIHTAHMRSIREVCSKDHSQEEIRGWGFRPLNDRWFRLIREEFVWVAEAGGKIQGFGHLKIFEKDGVKKAHVFGLYLTPELIGLRVGHKIATLMLETAHELGVVSVSLKSTITAHDFYKRLGFVDTGEMLQIEINGSLVRCYPMEMRI